jgi:hypothetical protein
MRPPMTRAGTLLPAAILMEIGDEVLYCGRVVRLLGHDPMSVSDRRAQIFDPETGEELVVPYDALEAATGFAPEA